MIIVSVSYYLYCNSVRELVFADDLGDNGGEKMVIPSNSGGKWHKGMALNRHFNRICFISGRLSSKLHIQKRAAKR